MPKGHTNNPNGQPTKLTPELLESIAQDVENGTPITKAFAANGIDKATGYRWLKAHPEVEARLGKADGQWEKKVWGRVTNSDDVKAQLIALKMKNPEYRDKGVDVTVTANATASAQAVPKETLERIQLLRARYTAGGLLN